MSTTTTDNKNQSSASDRDRLPIRGMFGLRVPMRDGITLAADVILPEAEGKYPVLFLRTPYLKTMNFDFFVNSPINSTKESFVSYLASHGYAVVMQHIVN